MSFLSACSQETFYLHLTFLYLSRSRLPLAWFPPSWVIVCNFIILQSADSWVLCQDPDWEMLLCTSSVNSIHLCLSLSFCSKMHSSSCTFISTFNTFVLSKKRLFILGIPFLLSYFARVLVRFSQNLLRSLVLPFVFIPSPSIFLTFCWMHLS